MALPNPGAEFLFSILETLSSFGKTIHLVIDSFFFPKLLYALNLWHSAGSLSWATTTLHILTGCEPPSPAHLSPSKDSPLCLVLLQFCDSCFCPLHAIPISPFSGFCSEQPVFFLHSPRHCSTVRNTNCSWLPLLISLGPVTAFDLTPISTTLLPFLAPSVCSIRKPSLAASQMDLWINPSTVLPSIYHWLLSYAPNPHFRQVWGRLL